MARQACRLGEGFVENDESEIHRKMGRDEALVFFEMLVELDDQPLLRTDRPSERLALVRLHGMLETALLEPFMPSYETLVAEARSRLEAQFWDADLTAP